MGGSGKVAYFYEPSFTDCYYGQGHPMKPHRVRMAHDLLLKYDILNQLEVFRPEPLSAEEMTYFHTDEYVEFLRLITPDNQHEHMRQLKRFNVGEDCPVFDGLFQFCQTYAGGSIGGAVRLNQRENEAVINWMGGLHHAKKTEASGFCYVNDIVLSILELLKVHARVLYIDIDIHHGDGVEEAFYTTDRVMTCSFHKFGEYFPGTGHLADVGHEDGKYYALNVPLKDGIDDAAYEALFKPVMAKVMEMFKPEAIVFQAGADSLSGDRLGCFNLSIRGHAECVRYMQTFGVPMLLLGGGGYTVRNVARCWAYETGVMLKTELEDRLPPSEYLEYYGPHYRLHFAPSNMENQNSAEYLATVRNRLLDNLTKMRPAPSVPFHQTPGTAPRVAAEREAAERAKDERDPEERTEAEAPGEGALLAGGRTEAAAAAAAQETAAAQDAEPMEVELEGGGEARA